MKRIIASLLAGLCLLALVGCSAGSKADSAAPKDYSQIIHDARTDEDNEYDMIFTKGLCEFDEKVLDFSSLARRPKAF